MPRRRKDCPICGKRNLVKLSNHLADIHQLSAVERKYYLSGASDPEKPGDMSSRKRMRSDSEDDISTVARDEESEEEMSSPKHLLILIWTACSASKCVVTRWRKYESDC